MKKKIAFLMLSLLIGLSVNSQVKFGAGLVLGTKSSYTKQDLQSFNLKPGSTGIGINGRANYSLPLFNLSFGTTYFIPSSVDNGFKEDNSEIVFECLQVNIDGHYLFLKKEKSIIYGIGGINYSIASLSFKIEGGKKIDLSKMGIDLGIGAKYNKLFGEAKFDTALDQIALTVGVNF